MGPDAHARRESGARAAPDGRRIAPKDPRRAQPTGERFLHRGRPQNRDLLLFAGRGRALLGRRSRRRPADGVSLPGVNGDIAYAFSPDGTQIAYGDTDRRIRIAAIAGGTPATLPGDPVAECDFLTDWLNDGKHLVVQNDCDVPERVYRVSLASGERSLWRDVQPSDGVGVIQVNRARFTSDGRGYAFPYLRTLASDLFLAEGLK
jgi:hypothetical protein